MFIVVDNSHHFTIEIINTVDHFIAFFPINLACRHRSGYVRNWKAMNELGCLTLDLHIPSSLDLHTPNYPPICFYGSFVGQSLFRPCVDFCA